MELDVSKKVWLARLENVEQQIEAIRAKRIKDQQQIQTILALKKQLEQSIQLKQVCFKGTEIPVTEADIQESIEKLADQLVAKYSPQSDETVLLCSLMDGALPFTGLLFEALQRRNFHYEYTTLQATSYTGTGSGSLTIKDLPKATLAGKHIIVLDDVCDTGQTYAEVKKLFERAGAKNVELMVLADKDQPRANGVTPDYIAVIVSKDEFLLGYGLDYYGMFRNIQQLSAPIRSTLPTKEQEALLQSEKGLNASLVKSSLEEESLLNLRLELSLKLDLELSFQSSVYSIEHFKRDYLALYDHKHKFFKNPNSWMHRAIKNGVELSFDLILKHAQNGGYRTARVLANWLSTAGYTAAAVKRLANTDPKNLDIPGDIQNMPLKPLISLAATIPAPSGPSLKQGQKLYKISDFIAQYKSQFAKEPSLFRNNNSWMHRAIELGANLTFDIIIKHAKEQGGRTAKVLKAAGITSFDGERTNDWMIIENSVHQERPMLNCK